MSNVISVENLGKKYTISHQQRGDNSSLREIITDSVASFGRKILSPLTRHSSPLPLASDFPDPYPLPHAPAVEDFWALKGISFDVKQGDRVGIIGRNGAGKSTLLKILSRITEPTTGRVKIKGRVASLLEVGTGFHPELTGRENIYLNGAILGMEKAEIKRKFNEIVDFAEIEKFLDTPVKRYSSGMYVRLAFAVAAHLEPEILVVDEVLAVGDAMFQKKCLGKMEDVSARDGRTVLFVSHNMSAIRHLCQRVIILENGAVRMDDQADMAISYYISSAADTSVSCEWHYTQKTMISNDYFTLNRMALTDKDGATLLMPIRNDSDNHLTVDFDLKKTDNAFQIGFALYDGEENLLFWSFNTDTSQESWPPISIGRNVFRVPLQKQLFNEGSYRLTLLAACYHREWLLSPGGDNPSIRFEIKGGLSQSPYWYEKRCGILAPVLQWQAETKE